MEPVYSRELTIEEWAVDRFLRLKPASCLYLIQEAAGQHGTMLSVGYEKLEEQGVFWAVSRHRVQMSRIPHLGETLRIETWPLPPTRSAFPRSVVAYDEAGNECFRSMSLWVLMDIRTRRMILPGKSGIVVAGERRGGELALPGGLIPRPAGTFADRTVAFSDLDRNGHMNNTRCMEWFADLLPASFHESHLLKEFTVCYLAEAREGDVLRLNLEMPEDSDAQLDAFSGTGEDLHRVFSARLYFEPASTTP